MSRWEAYTCETRSSTRSGLPTGQERGAVWFPVGTSHARCDDNQGTGYTGREGVALGGIPALDAQGDFSPAHGA